MKYLTMPFVILLMIGLLSAQEIDQRKPKTTDDDAMSSIMTLRRDYGRNLRRAEMLWRQSMAKLLNNADRIVVHELEGKLTTEEAIKKNQMGDYFSILPYHLYSKKNHSKTLTEVEIKDFKKVFSEILENSDDNEPVFDHKPEYAVTIYWGKTVLFQTSISFTCANYYALYGVENQVGWVDFSSVPLKELFKKYFP